MKMTRFTCILFLGYVTCQANEAWESRSLIRDFYAEGAAVGDLDGDGKPDLAYGPFWLAGPDFAKPIRFAEGESFDGGKGYSDNFFSFIHDCNGDGRADILVFGFPGKEARLYINPGAKRQDESWPMFLVADQVANESPHFVDLIPGGLPEIVCAREKTYGFYLAGPDATQAWTWHPISAAGDAATPFGHGLGVGDLNQDGRADVVEKDSWYEQPAASGELWTKHKWAPISYGGGGAQILVNDIDGDGDADIVTSYNAHGYGLGWFEQYEPGKFAPHSIMGERSTESPYGVAFSQLHALALVDMDGDGRNDFVTGKRHFAHQGKDPGGLGEPVLVWFRNTANAAGEIEFVPHLVDRSSGVGVEVKVGDLNGDSRPDIVTSSKMGLFVHLQKGDFALAAMERWQVPGGRPQDDYGSGLTAQEALTRMEMPPGFSVDLIAAEPDIVQPIAMCFDARGRLWVVEGMNYPQRAPEGEGKDRILIFEDSDADGSFETRKVFAEKINLASGIEVGFGGVYVGAAPNLYFYPDKNADDVPDGEPEILLDGWGYEDTHETLNAFTWGPDGWLYGCHGVFTHSRVGKPGTADEARVPINAGVWRFHPVTQAFEVYAHGASNPWGVDFNEWGDFFVSACVIPHFYHLSQGGRYQRQAGSHFDPYTFDDIKTIADHAHYAGNWTDVRTKGAYAPADTSALGGGHAHCGLVIYQADEFPVGYRGQAFFHNLHGHRMVREHLEGNGSSYLARHRPDFVLSNNHENIGVALRQGPDGALYFSDWVDPQTCHHRDVEIWDRSNGRLYRVRAGEAKSTVLDLPGRSDGELVATLGHANVFHARQAQRLLQERAASGTLDAKAVTTAFVTLEKEHASDPGLRLRALWARHATGLTTSEQLLALLQDPDEHLRGWAVTLLDESTGPLSADALSALEALATGEESLFVRRHLASKLQRLPLEQRWELAKHLIGHGRSQYDGTIPYLCWYGIEPLVEANPVRAIGMVNQTGWLMIKDFLTRRAAVFPEGRSAIMSSLTEAKQPEAFVERAGQLLASLANLPPVESPAGWASARARGESWSAENQNVARVLAALGARFGDADFFPTWRKVAADASAKNPDRIEAINLLTVGKDPELGPIAQEALKTPALRKVAIAALRLSPGAESAAALISQLAGFEVGLRNDAINLLATRADTARALLEAVDQKVIEPSLISPVMLDQFERFEDETISALIKKHWVRGEGGVDLAQLASSIEQWKGKLNPKVMAKANPSRGRLAFTQTCGTCHQLFGEGVALGPDLTGSNRADLGYLLENALAPSAVVGKDYLLHIFTMKDGSTLSGVVREETPDGITLVMPGGSSSVVEAAAIASREEIPQSLMPPGLFEALPLETVADLVSYLGSPAQVPLPGNEASAPVADEVPPLAKGALRYEGEALVEQAQSTPGQVRPQSMGGFGKSWSANSQLWWTGGKPGDVLTLKLAGISPGTHNVTLFPTTAHDYAQVKIAINGQLREVDWYSLKVLPGDPVRFEKVNVSPTEPLQIDIHITGKNAEALERYMVGIDRIEVE
jgi:putative membrane-bound dehydrogenase-like protein